MPFVQADRDALINAHKLGVERFRLADGRETVLNSKQFWLLLARMDSDIAAAAAVPGTPTSRLVRVGHSSGITGGPE